MMSYSEWGLGASPRLLSLPFTINTFLSKIGAIFSGPGMNQTKYCKGCNRSLSLERFNKDRKIKDGHAFYCKDCTSEYGKKYRNKIKKTPLYIYSALKARAEHYKHKLCNISYENFTDWYEKEPRICHYCDLPEELLNKVDDVMNIRISRLSIDCMDNKRGYTKGNLVLSCHRCNYTKNDAFTHEQMLYIGKNFLKPRWKKDIQTKTDVIKSNQLGFEVPE